VSQCPRHLFARLLARLGALSFWFFTRLLARLGALSFWFFTRLLAGLGALAARLFTRLLFARGAGVGRLTSSRLARLGALSRLFGRCPACGLLTRRLGCGARLLATASWRRGRRVAPDGEEQETAEQGSAEHKNAEPCDLRSRLAADYASHRLPLCVETE